MNFITIINAVTPSYNSIRSHVSELREAFPEKSNEELAELFCNRIRGKYTSVGVATALPSVIPGVGTVAQVAVEVSTVSAELALMLRWMAVTCFGTALIYGRDIENEFNQEFVKILGLWCGVIKTGQATATKMASKVAIKQFDRHISDRALKAINRKVGTTILTKYGTKRGGLAIGKLIPFGVGAAIAGTFNYITMNQFKKQAISYFGASAGCTFTVADDITEEVQDKDHQPCA